MQNHKLALTELILLQSKQLMSCILGSLWFLWLQRHTGCCRIEFPICSLSSTASYLYQMVQKREHSCGFLQYDRDCSNSGPATLAGVFPLISVALKFHSHKFWELMDIGCDAQHCRETSKGAILHCSSITHIFIRDMLLHYYCQKLVRICLLLLK